jgi:hypothetical protein
VNFQFKNVKAMSTKIFLFLVVWTGSLFMINGCKGGVAGTDEIIETEKSAAIAGDCIVSGTITEEDAKALLFMMDEEKMARDVYTWFSTKYNLPVFKNISKSEGIHMKAVGNLIAGFKLTYTGSDVSGEFVNADIKKLYKNLTEAGSVSLEEALKAGALIEETDILDLEEEIMKTANPSVKLVFGNLLKGSENHLRAFTGVLKVRKIMYEPVLLSIDYYKAVLDKTSATINYEGKRAK